MAKAGDDYQAIVEAVARAVHKDAKVTVGDWVEGPDGQRDMDVRVQPPGSGPLLLECKDRSRPIGIGVIDALESKRRDLGVEAALIYSNSGFTRQALLKAERVGIGALSAVKADDDRIRLFIGREWIAKALAVERWGWTLYFDEGFPIPTLPEDFKIVTYKGADAANWAAPLSKRLLDEFEGAERIRYTVRFRRPQEFAAEGVPVRLTALSLLLHCSRKWLSQTVRTDVSLGHFDHVSKRLVIPDKQAYILGPVVPDAWVPVEKGWEQELEDLELEPGSFELRMTLYRQIPAVEGPTPDIDALVSETLVATNPTLPRRELPRPVAEAVHSA